MRYDLAFFLCCCKSFLGSDPEGEESFYNLLGVERDASPDEIKRAYKKKSLQMHPDKLAQRGQTATEQDQAAFTRMKEGYEILSDPHKRDTYDAIGERGMKWIDEPFSIDPQELAHNFAKSSTFDRAKIFAIFVAIAIATLLLPVLVCLHVDGRFGPTASWMATLTPLWLWNAFLLFYHVRVVMMGPIPRPDSIPEQDWVDPLPMKKRLLSLGRFALLFLFQILAGLKLDGTLTAPWTFVFVPLYAWEATMLYKKWPLARMRIVTVEDLEAALGKPFNQFTAAEKELIGKRYSVVPSTTSPEFDVAQKLKLRARHDIIKSAFRIIFVLVIIFQLDGAMDWNWFLVFLPFWILTGVICFANYQSFAEVKRVATEKDPTLFAAPTGAGGAGESSSSTAAEADAGAGGPADYGAVGENGAATAEDTAQKPASNLTEEEREELKAQVLASSSRLCSKCCSQGFLVFIVCLFVGKLQGAGYSAFWIISPFLFAASVILCCIGCAIFGITEVPTDGVEFDPADFAYHSAESGTAAPQSTPAAGATATPATAAEPLKASSTAQQQTFFVGPAGEQPPAVGPVQDNEPTPPAGTAAPIVLEPTTTTTTPATVPVQQEEQKPAVVIPPAPASASPQVVDLLDDVENQNQQQQQQSEEQPPSTSDNGELHDLD